MKNRNSAVSSTLCFLFLAVAFTGCKDDKIGPFSGLKIPGTGGEKDDSQVVCHDGLRAKLHISRTKPDGSDWDVSAGHSARPDPKGRMRLKTPDGKTYSERISKRNNKFSVSAPMYRGDQIVVGPQTKLYVRVIDKDLKYDDPIATIRQTIDTLPTTVKRGPLTLTLMCWN